MKCFRIITSCLLMLLVILPIFSEVNIEYCVKRAEENYPLIRKYGLLDATKEIELSDINKSWLPRISLSAQATVQNLVPSYPEALQNVLIQMGQKVEGLGHIQYKLGVDLNQTIWDGGTSKSRREVVLAQENVKKASLEVELYTLRERVENIYFAILLCEEQISQSKISEKLLEENLERLQSMFRNGVAMQSDVDMVEAQLLGLRQNIISVQSNMDACRKMLEVFIGESLGEQRLEIPVPKMPDLLENDRPELRLFTNRLNAIEAADRLSSTSVMPKIGFFAQGYYGYPGFDYFRSMMSRNLSLNLLAGIKVSWNIDAFYTLKNTHRKNTLNSENISIEKEIFLFNSRLKISELQEMIEGIKKVMADDSKIIELRSSVRKAAESQLKNGIIDATALLSKISDENIARLNSKFHLIQLLQQIYKLKYTLNR